MAETITVDYLVVGAGATGMAFVDTIISDTKATVAIVDRFDRPGGHWTIAYPFVRLHQPSSFYGVNSRRLGHDQIDQVGWNKGLFELATVHEVCGYYNIVMQHTFLPSGRVTYYPRHEYRGDGKFQSTVTGKVFSVGAATCIVNTTYMKVKVPAMGRPPYEVSDGVDLITLNRLPEVTRPYACYTVIGAGKTGVDACLWLLAHGIDPQRVTWIIPRDAWMFERGTFQRSASMMAMNKAFMTATSPEDLLRQLEACEHLVRLDKNVRPTTFRCSTVSLAELEQLKTIGTIVRQGRVVRLDTDQVIMQKGTYKATSDTIYIDCAGDALAKVEPVPVFRGKHITLQHVRYCQPVFSAAFIAHVEATYNDDKLKNELCRVIQSPDEPMDYIILKLQTHQNWLRWSKHPKTLAWLAQARLDWFGRLWPAAPDDPAKAAKFYAGLAAQAELLCANLERLVNQLPAKDVQKIKAQL